MRPYPARQRFIPKEDSCQETNKKEAEQIHQPPQRNVLKLRTISGFASSDKFATVVDVGELCVRDWQVEEAAQRVPAVLNLEVQELTAFRTFAHFRMVRSVFPFAVGCEVAAEEHVPEF